MWMKIYGNEKPIKVLKVDTFTFSTLKTKNEKHIVYYYGKDILDFESIDNVICLYLTRLEKL